MMSNIWTNGGYSYLIEMKTLWQIEKLLVTSNFSFSHNVLKSCLLLMQQNEYLWGKGFLPPKFFSNADFLKNNTEKIIAETKS